MTGQEDGFVYRRDDHPNQRSLVQDLQLMHSAERGALTAQGMSALAAVILGTMRPGEHVLLAQPAYGKTSVLLNDMVRWGIHVRSIRASDLDDWRQGLQPPVRLAIVETITNPRMGVPNMEAIATECRKAGILLMVDNTFASPALFRPMEWGADWVLESLSKIVCGHSDAMLGFLGGLSANWDPIPGVISMFGMAASPLDCWLTRRGLRTLELRLDRACQNALAMSQIAAWHPAIRAVDYSGLPSHPDHEVARRQFGNRFGHMLAVHFHGGPQAASCFIEAVQDSIPFCPSLGEVQTTLSHPASTSHRWLDAQQQAQLGIDGSTVRISAGIEPTEELLRHWTTGLDRAARKG